jgi:uncharacterized protein (DUF2062 family)
MEIMKTIRFNPVRPVIAKLKSIQADPKKIIYGFAFGVFMSTTPLIGFKWLVALPIVMLAKWNKMACLAGIMQVNYLTGPFFYALAYFVGKTACGFKTTFQMPEQMSFGAFKEIFFGNTDVFISLLTGGLLLSIPMTIGAFYLVKALFYHKLNPQVV